MSDDLGNVISKNRQKRIIEQLKNKGTVTVAELSSDLGVSPITIRRDLDKLDEKGILARTHGGAMINYDIQGEHPFDEKNAMQIREKAAIGRVAADLVKDGDTLFINSGSTVLEVLKNLRHKHVRIVTNNTVATAIPLDPKVELILVGGEYRDISHSLIGEFARIVLSQIYSSITILGVNGVDVDHGLTTSVFHETGINKTMIERSRGPVVIVADNTKIGVVSNFVTAPISAATTLVVDDAITEEMTQKFTSIGLEVIPAPLI